MHVLMTPEFPILKDQFLQVLHFKSFCYKTHLQQSVGMPQVIILLIGAYLSWTAIPESTGATLMCMCTCSSALQREPQKAAATGIQKKPEWNGQRC